VPTEVVALFGTI